MNVLGRSKKWMLVDDQQLAIDGSKLIDNKHPQLLTYVNWTNVGEHPRNIETENFDEISRSPEIFFARKVTSLTMMEIMLQVFKIKE